MSDQHPKRPSTNGDPTPPSPASKDDSPGIGVYVCHCGGNISDVVDVQGVVNQATGLDGVAVARTNTFMCSDPGQNMILEDIRAGRVDRVVIAACSPSLHETTFRSLLSRADVNPFLVEQANIREQCSWVHHHPQEATTKATTLVRMAVGKAGHLQPLSPVRVDAVNLALVVGGGVAGLRAARDLAGLGIDVELVERDAELGGFVRQLDQLYPDGESARALIERLVSEVEREPRITIHRGAEVQSMSGYVGSFTATIAPTGKDAGAPWEIQAGVVVVATGFRPYAPTRREFGCGRLPGVITLPELGRMLAELPADAEALELDGRPVRSVGFIHCVGSRQIDGVHKPPKGGTLNPHCSRVCCTATLQAAVGLRQRFADVAIHDLYQDIRAYGRGHEELYAQASAADVIFHRYAGDNPPKVRKAPEDDECGLIVNVVDGLTWGEELEIGVDLVVLSVGMTPGDISNITEGLKLSTSADGFLQEVHPKLRPVEMAVNGVLLAGACQGPKDIGESTASASAAAVKAAALLGKGYVELPPYVAEVDPARCVGSGQCVEVCPVEGAIRLDGGDGAMRAAVNPALCTGCGCCVAVCGEQALDVAGWTLNQFGAMVDAITLDEESVSG